MIRPATNARSGFGWAATAPVILVAWELAGRLLGVEARVLPTPTRIALEISSNWARLRDHAPDTAIASVLGLSAGAGAAMVLALLCSARSGVARHAEVVLRLLDRTPLLLFAPLLGVWLGSGIRSKILLATLVALIPTALEILGSLERLDPTLGDLFHLLGGGRRQILVGIVLPSTLPALVRGVRRAATPVVFAVIFSEMIGVGDRGMGWLLLTASARLEMPTICAMLVAVAGLCLLLHAAVDLTARLLRGAGYISS